MKAIQRAVSNVVLPVACSLSLILICNDVFAKTANPGQVHASGTSVAPSGASGAQSKWPYPPVTCRRNCHPGHTQPTCHGPHKGPNGVMIQCD
jgi:hypothetical protein